MKLILLTLLFGLSNVSNNQEKPIDKWIQHIVNDMIEMNDLGKYSNKEISPELKVNFIMVEAVKDIKADNGIISMLINHGNGKYCTELKLKYIETDGKFYLIFAEPKNKTILGMDYEFIDPWIEKNKVCD